MEWPAPPTGVVVSPEAQPEGRIMKTMSGAPGALWQMTYMAS
jgi:hypothetical protein